MTAKILDKDTERRTPERRGSAKGRARLSRRTFLKALGAGGAAAASLPVSGARAASRKDGGGGKDEELVTLFNLAECVGCGECVSACRESNAHKFPKPEKPFPKMYPSRVKVEDWSDRQDVDDRLTPYNWLFIQTADVEYKGESWEINIPRRCLHCQNPPCANLCPWGAARKEHNGIVRIDDDICLGGSKCNKVCPWHIPQRQTGVGLYLDLMPSLAGNGVMYKCDRCHDRIAEGELPACIEACPFDVQQIGPRSEMVARARELAEEMNGFIYGLDENGGTNTIYVSPVPFDLLDAAVEKGAGKPGLPTVGNLMAAEDQLVRAMVMAPVAGIAAGFLKAASSLKKSGDGGRGEQEDENA